MSTLYGSLVAQASREHEVHTSALHANADLVNRFGDEMRQLDLVPHVRPEDSKSVVLVAHCVRGRDYRPVLETLTGRGYKVAPPKAFPFQFNDGYVIWSARVSNREMAFDLVYYTPAPAAGGRP